jgi:uncharacterized protein (TIGR02145 family)
MRNFQLEEIKVRWKKAALENCPGVPCVTGPSFTCGTSTIVDMDGNSYNTVAIGTQCWTKENLKVTLYNDGTLIPLGDPGSTVSPVGTSTIWRNLTTGAYSIYDNESSTGTNATNYGFLYNWNAAKGISTTGSVSYKNLCPTGWHVPSDSDWNKLVKFIDSGADTSSSSSSTQSPNAGGKMKSTSALWNTASPPSPGTDNYGFSALPGGYRASTGDFGKIRDVALFWSATEYFSGASSYGRTRYLYNNNSDVERNYNIKSFGASVRCLMD